MRPAVVTLLLLTACSVGATEPTCSTSEPLLHDTTLIGFSRATESMLHVAGVLHDDTLSPHDGRGLSSGVAVYGLLHGSGASVEAVEPYLSRQGEDHCVYPATLSIPTATSWEIWSTRADLAARLRQPTQEELASFQNRQPDCVEQGDPPRCVDPMLLAVSDLDRDQAMEYWHTLPYRWATGLRVAEDRAGGLATLIAACPGCAD